MGRYAGSGYSDGKQGVQKTATPQVCKQEEVVLRCQGVTMMQATQFFASQMINLEWVQPGSAEHRISPSASDIRDAAGHVLVTSYAVLRPDGQWSLMLVNKDQESPHAVRIAFHSDASGSDSHFAGSVDVVTFGSEQYKWHTDLKLVPVGGSADPDGPAARSTISAGVDTIYTLPKASVTVMRGKLAATVSAAKPH